MSAAVSSWTARVSARAKTPNCGRWRSSSPRKLATRGLAQEIGPLNPYERRIVHLAVSEVEKVSSESIGDAFEKTVIIAVK